MRNIRIYHPKLLAIGQEIELEPKAATHLTRALRMPLDTILVLFNGDGFEYSARLNRIQRHRSWVIILDKQAINNESPLNIRLCQGISKGERMEYTIQKAVELGVTHITPLFTEYGTVQLKAERVEKRVLHWQGIANSACEQSGRNCIAIIDPPEKLDTWLQTYHDTSLKLTLAPDASTTLKSVSPVEKSITILIGAEGGLSQKEMALSHQHGFISVKLGPRILRTETAALTAISIIQNLWGDLG